MVNGQSEERENASKMFFIESTLKCRMVVLALGVMVFHLSISQD